MRRSQTIRHCRSMCGSKFQWTCGLLFWFVPVAVACAKMDLLVTMHLALCVLRLTRIPKCQAPRTRKTVMKALRALGACAYACKAQASARVDVPTAPEVPGDLRQCARREGLEVRLSREWVRAFLVSIVLSISGCSTTTRPIHISAETRQMLQEELGHILTALRCGVDAPIQG